MDVAERIQKLEDALRPFVEYMKARRNLFGDHSQYAYVELLLQPNPSHKLPVVSLAREDWLRAEAALEEKP